MQLSSKNHNASIFLAMIVYICIPYLLAITADFGTKKRLSNHGAPEAFFGSRKKKTKKQSIPHVPGNSVDSRYVSRENIFATPPFNFFRITFLSYFHVSHFL